ncbi:Mitochondrial import inner membrane translocase subunit tim8 [Maublancomyces gigas]|uniref:Mitochondrial import inner membrane translocase subunit n=1 Tax=Discina gigas TaxID=1032678 RepID=A0ABR3GMQ4_9PEZI
MDSQAAASSMSDFNESDRKELQQFIENEHQKAKFQTNVHNLTDMCWSKCMTAKISGTTIDKNEKPCLENCVNRFIDSQKTIVKQLDYMGGRA